MAVSKAIHPNGGQHRRNMGPNGGCSLCGGTNLWMAKCVWALEREEITEFICQLQTPDARAWHRGDEGVQARGTHKGGG